MCVLGSTRASFAACSSLFYQHEEEVRRREGGWLGARFEAGQGANLGPPTHSEHSTDGQSRCEET